MKKSVRIFFVLVLVLCAVSAVYAQDKKSAPEAKAKPEVAASEPAAKEAGVPVLVEHSGNDELGGTLALKLKENFRKSVLFKLADKNAKAVHVKVVSRSEFSERPEIGSVYAVVWTFAESQDVVPFYLSEELGLVAPANVESRAAGLMNLTDRIAQDYKYLFE
ncbi:hypothetical protein [Maridesulfovibrio sp.]|uniref:hypothetical protein n=1 Tax=Maridesulfovibrio sp. TaxID=2795000 RepID=UPI002A18ABC4|nr:hypothetical protein [Maridesulfovibrio sp.]